MTMETESKILWYPNELIDEVMPEGMERPEDWLPYLLGTKVDEDIFLAGDAVPGDTVGFVYVEEFPSFMLSVTADGQQAGLTRCTETADMFDPDYVFMPGDRHPRANHFWSDELEITGDFDFALYQAAQDKSLLEWHEGVSTSFSLNQCHWSDTVTFIISEDGKKLLPFEATTEEKS